MCNMQRSFVQAACRVAARWLVSALAIAAQASDAIAVADHQRGTHGSVEALDLDHGQATARLMVRRVWQGAEGTHRHFGPGWGDPNLVRLTPIAANQTLLWRAGVGCLLFDREGEEFVAPGGAKLQAAADGWTIRHAQGDQLHFDRQGRLLREVPALGNTRNYSYDQSGRLASISAGPGNFLVYQYDAHGRTTRIDGPEGLTLAYQYDAAGRLTQAVNARQVKIEYQYNSSGQLRAIKDSFGNAASPPDAASDRPAPAASPALPADLLLASVDVKLNPQGCVEQCRDASGITRHAYDAQGRLASVQTAAGAERFEYDAFGRRIATVSPDGRTRRVQYNALDLPVLVEHADGRRERFQYNAQGQLMRREASPDDWEAVEYDSRGRLATIRRAPAQEERCRYDEQNRVLETAYPEGRSVRYEYSADGRTVTQHWSDGSQLRLTHDENDRLVERQTAAGLLTRYAYDARGNLSTIEDPVHGQTRFTYSPTGLQYTIEQDDAGRTVYDLTPDQRVWAITDPLDRKTLFQHHASGNPALLIRPSGMAWRYAYDAAGNWTEVESPDNRATAIAYDSAGRITEIRRGTVVWRQYAYDAQGRLAEEKSPTGVAARYRYDAQGRPSELDSPAGLVRFEQQADGRRKTIAGPDYRLEEELHADGALARRAYQPCGLELRLPRDAQGRTAGVALNDLRVEYGYDQRGQLQRISLPGGATIEITADEAGRFTRVVAGPLSTTIAYDRADRITSIEAAGKAGQSLFAERCRYDAAGNLTKLERGADAHSFAYDRDDQLTEIASAGQAWRCRYDAAGNMLWSETSNPPRRYSRELDADGRLTAHDGGRMQYDAAGNLTSFDRAEGPFQLNFDAASRLRELSMAKNRWRFGYLPDGDRLWQEGPQGRTWYAYLPDGLAGLKDPSGTVWLVVRLPGSDRPLALCGGNGQTYFVVTDRLGSTRRLVDASGTVVVGVDFGTWGQWRPSPQPVPWLEYAGMLVEPHGLWYARQRYYCPEWSCFISPDPLLGEPGKPASHNAYSYAANSPQRFRDPLGTEPYLEFTQALDRVMTQDLNPREAAEVRRLTMLNDQLEQLKRGKDPAMRWIARNRAQELAGRVEAINQQAYNRWAIANGYRDPPVRLNPTPSPNPGQTQRIPWRAGEGTQRVVRPGGGTGSLVAAGTGRLTGAYNAYTNIRSAVQMGGAAGEAYVGWLDGPFAEQRRDERDARHAGNELRNRLIQMLNDPTRRGNLPPRADGQPWDPNNPEHFDDLFNGVVNNINSNRPAFAGMAPNPGDKLKAALEEAQGLLNSARVYRKTILAAQADAAKQDAQAQSDLQKALALAAAKGALYAQLLGMPAAAQEVKSQAAAAEKAASGVTAASDAAAAAKTKAENAATTVCAYAGRDGAAAEFDQWRQQSDSLIQAAETDVNAAQGKLSPIDSAADALRTAMQKLKAYKEAAGKLIDLENAAQLFSKDKSTATELLLSAQKAAETAKQARSGIPQWRTKLDGTLAQIRSVLQPYQNDPQAQLLASQAQGLGAGLDAESLGNFSALLATAQPVVDAFTKTLDALTAGITGINVLQTLADGQAALDKASNSDSRQAARDLAAAQAALSRARNCRAKIGVGSPPDAPTSPGNRVKVPAVTGMKVDEAVAAVRKVGLVADPQLSGEFPASAEKTVVNGQQPSAGAEVDAGATVTIAFSATQPAQPQTPASDKTEVPDVVNMSARAAYVELAGANLGADSTFLKEPAPPGKEGTVKSQNPKGRATVRLCDIVQLEIYGQVVPSVIGWRVDTASDIANEAGMTVDKVALDRRPPTEADAERVYLQNPPGGELIQPDRKSLSIHAYSQW